MRIRGATFAFATVFAAGILASSGLPAAGAENGSRQNEALKNAREAYEGGQYDRATQILREASAQNPQDGEIQLLLAKTYYEAQQHDAAISAAERAVTIDPQSSVNHEWLGRVYGEKANHAVMFSALSLAKKARKEFARAVELDQGNFSAQQALIEFDCSAPGIAGGGEDKARAEIAQVAAMDAAEGHYAAGNCRRQKKDFAAADAEFDKALGLHPKSADLIFDIGDYAMKHEQPERLLAVAEEGAKAAPQDVRAEFYRGAGWILRSEHLQEAEQLLRDYLRRAPVRSTYPHAWRAHEWLGRLYEQKHDSQSAISEYETSLKLEPKNKNAHEALKRLRKG
jgi:tetratricopeptide (TPR) repeat protein